MNVKCITLNERREIQKNKHTHTIYSSIYLDRNVEDTWGRVGWESIAKGHKGTFKGHGYVHSPDYGDHFSSMSAKVYQILYLKYAELNADQLYLN
jgi:hypothetical protein